MGTGGGIANVAGKLRNDTAMVFNGDVLSGADLAQLLDFHRSNRADVTLQLVRVGDRGHSAAYPPTRRTA